MRKHFKANIINTYDEATMEVKRLNRAFDVFFTDYISLLDTLHMKPFIKKNEDYFKYLKYAFENKYIDEYEMEAIEKAIYRGLYFFSEYTDEQRTFSIEETNDILQAAAYVLNEGSEIVERKLDEYDATS